MRQVRGSPKQNHGVMAQVWRSSTPRLNNLSEKNASRVTVPLWELLE